MAEVFVWKWFKSILDTFRLHMSMKIWSTAIIINVHFVEWVFNESYCESFLGETALAIRTFLTLYTLTIWYELTDWCSGVNKGVYLTPTCFQGMGSRVDSLALWSKFWLCRCDIIIWQLSRFPFLFISVFMIWFTMDSIVRRQTSTLNFLMTSQIWWLLNNATLHACLLMAVITWNFAEDRYFSC